MSQHNQEFHPSLGNRPLSANLETAQRTNLQMRPSSEVLVGHYKSPEAEVLSLNMPVLWFEDLSYYERTLEQMAKAKLDDNFREELKAIEQWFSVLTEPERTTALYSLLQQTSQVQIRFFITVLQQMLQKEAPPVAPFGNNAQNSRGFPVTQGINVNQKINAEMLSGNVGAIGRGGLTAGGQRRLFDRHSAPPTEESFGPLGYPPIQYQGTEADDFAFKRQSVGSSASNRSSLQMGRPKTPIEDSLNFVNWSVAPGHERLKLGNGSINSIVTSPRTGVPGMADEILAAELAKLSVSSSYRDSSPHRRSGSNSPVMGGYSPSSAAFALAQAQAGLNLHNQQALLAAAGIQHPGPGWGHVDLNVYRQPGSPTGYSHSDYSDSYEYESGDNSSNGMHAERRMRGPNTAHKEKGKIPDSIDMEALK
ncbi:hypothetical protein HK096_008217, partial [Nowakowskiella sp. JEL0078]